MPPGWRNCGPTDGRSRTAAERQEEDAARPGGEERALILLSKGKDVARLQRQAQLPAGCPQRTLQRREHPPAVYRRQLPRAAVKLEDRSFRNT